MFRVVVAGGRDFNDYELLERKLTHFLSKKKPHEAKNVYLIVQLNKNWYATLAEYNKNK